MNVSPPSANYGEYMGDPYAAAGGGGGAQAEMLPDQWGTGGQSMQQGQVRPAADESPLSTVRDDDDDDSREHDPRGGGSDAPWTFRRQGGTLGGTPMSQEHLTGLAYEQRKIMRGCRGQAAAQGGLPGAVIAMGAAYFYAKRVKPISLAAYFLYGLTGYFTGLTMALTRCVKPKMEQLKYDWQRQAAAAPLASGEEAARPPPPPANAEVYDGGDERAAPQPVQSAGGDTGAPLTYDELRRRNRMQYTQQQQQRPLAYGRQDDAQRSS